MKHKPPSERDSKTCPVCGRPFLWRKKWEKVWPEVVYCSDRCRNARRTRSEAEENLKTN
ncbi:DUF2256 domain-containing protein [Deinococcus misasensis]|uniref:DUF2256 domain-containing protein n=1 Tax=Deinococcus misasensis TaxID=392413 RepID=UPI000A073A58|nr:DUF2256 domain-containing protein [Deinococcus misasensis]